MCACMSTDGTSATVSAKLASTIYAPYKPYIRQYKSFEETTLATALDVIPLDAEDILDTAALLAESVPKLFAAASQVPYSVTMSVVITIIRFFTGFYVRLQVCFT